MTEEEVDERSEYVPLVYARSFDEAERYCQLLEDHDIPAIMDEDYESPSAGGGAHHHGAPVLVPEAMLEEARSFMAQLEDMEGFGEDETDEDEDEDEFGPTEGFEVDGQEQKEEHEEEKYF